MVQATCHRCGREWEYTGGSDHYGTCPNCKTSVKLHKGSERARPEPETEVEAEAERRPDPSDPTPRTVEVVGDEMPVPEGVERLDWQLAQVASTVERQGGSVAELERRVDERARSLDELERGIEEVADFFKQFVDAQGGEVEYEHIDLDDDLPELLEKIEEAEDEWGPLDG